MEESNNNLISVTMAGNEQNIYCNHLEMPKSFTFDQGTNLTELGTGADFCELNFGIRGEFKENKDPLMSEKDIEGLADTAQIDSHFFDVSEVTKEMMNSLQEAVDFDESLMPQLEADFAMFTEGSPQPVEDSVQLQMDIRDPLSNMQRKIGKILQKSLDDYTICLQGSQLLEGHKNLVDQCVQGEGMVQINVQVQHDVKQINIIDVLKPAEDFANSPTENEPEKVSVKQQVFEEEELPASKKNIVQWQVDAHFKKEQERLKIPSDPTEWNDLHVRYWVQWAVRQFNLPQLKLSDWTMDGAQLHQLTLADFQRIVPNDPGDVFWTHLELLRQMKLVAVVREKESKDSMKPSSKLTQQAKISRIIPNYSSAGRYFESAGNKSGFNNQIQLWQFLLDLLTSRQHKNIIHWLVGTDGEFKLANPEKVAELWGERKNKPSMNYEKLSRGLRYYYQGDMISKVHGKRFTYKFVCDLKQLVGYSAVELANLVEFGTPKPGY